MDKNCKGCIYYRKIGVLNGYIYGCHYCVDTGNLRECPSNNCNKKDTNPEHKINAKLSYAEWCLKSRLSAANGY